MAGTTDRRPRAALEGSLPGVRLPGPRAAGRPRAALRRPIAHSCLKPCVAPGLGSVLPAQLASRSHRVRKRGCYSGGPATPGRPAAMGPSKEAVVQKIWGSLYQSRGRPAAQAWGRQRGTGHTHQPQDSRPRAAGVAGRGCRVGGIFLSLRVSGAPPQPRSSPWGTWAPRRGAGSTVCLGRAWVSQAREAAPCPCPRAWSSSTTFTP